jgi:hypothetical protein
MKKTLSAVVVAMLSLSVVAPAMAWDEKNCPFRDKSMCEHKSIYND